MLCIENLHKYVPLVQTQDIINSYLIMYMSIKVYSDHSLPIKEMGRDQMGMYSKHIKTALADHLLVINVTLFLGQ